MPGAALIDVDTITRCISNALPGAEVGVYDMTGGGDHYKVVVVSQAFANLALIKRHRLVYAALQGAFDSGALHALALDTKTPQEAVA